MAGVLLNTEKSILADPVLADGEILDAERADASLLNLADQRDPVGEVVGKSDAVLPDGVLVAGGDSNGMATDRPLGNHGAVLGVERVTEGRGGLHVIQANGLGNVEGEGIPGHGSREGHQAGRGEDN